MLLYGLIAFACFIDLGQGYSGNCVWPGSRKKREAGIIEKNEALAFLVRNKRCVTDTGCDDPEVCIEHSRCDMTETYRENICQECDVGTNCIVTDVCAGNVDCQDIDECNSNPCMNGATCNNLLSQYNCSCTEDFTGVNCETDMCLPQHQNGADIIFILDSSLSNGEEGMKKTRKYTKQMISEMTSEPGNFRFSIMSFSNHNTIHFELGFYSNETIQAMTDNLDIISDGPTCLSKALGDAQETFDYISGSRTRYIVVLTDGLVSDRSETIARASALKNMGVTITAVAIGNSVYHPLFLDIVTDHTKVFIPATSDISQWILRQHVLEACPDCILRYSNIAFLMEASADTELNLYYKQIEAIKLMIKGLTLSADGIKASYTRFAGTIYEEFKFSDYATTDEALKDVQSPRNQISEVVDIAFALNHMKDAGFLAAKGANPNSRNILVLLYSGPISKLDCVQNEANDLKSSGVILAVVTARHESKLNMTSLRNIASSDTPGSPYLLRYIDPWDN